MKYSKQELPDFDGAFSLVVEDEQSGAMSDQFVKRVSHMMRSYARATKTPDDGRNALRANARAASIRELQILTDEVISGKDVNEGVIFAYIIQGRWEKAIEQINFNIDFTVREVDDTRTPLGSGTADLAYDLFITVTNITIPESKIALKLEIDRTVTIVKVILPKPNLLNIMALSRRLTTAGATPRQRRSDYIRKIAGIARIGLQGTDPSLIAFARQSLDSLRYEIVALEAGMVKNRYLRRLGLRSLLVGAGSLLTYWLLGSSRCDVNGHNITSAICDTLIRGRNFCLIFAGTAIGTWLSFSIRRTTLSFLDLGALEEDRLDPTMRLLFVTALAGVVSLLFWTNAVTVGIGDFRSDFALSGSHALLIGLLLGIAERTMATAVSRRASDFTAAIGSK